MSGFLPWLLLFFLIFFAGIFFLVYFSLRVQERALHIITSRQDAMREELERLADALDALLAESEVADEVIPSVPQSTGGGASSIASAAVPVPGDAVPGLDRLLLGEDPQAAGPEAGAASRTPDHASDRSPANGGTAVSGLPDLHL